MAQVYCMALFVWTVWLVWLVWLSLCFCPDSLQPVTATTATARSAIAANAASLSFFVVCFMSGVCLVVLLRWQARGSRGAWRRSPPPFRNLRTQVYGHYRNRAHSN